MAGITQEINLDNSIVLSVSADEVFGKWIKHGTIKVNNATLTSMEQTKDGKFNIEAKIYNDLNIEISKDYQVKYNELRATIATQLEALKPWYISGKVGSPMNAVEALKNIDKAVRQ